MFPDKRRTSTNTQSAYHLCSLHPFRSIVIAILSDRFQYVVALFVFDPRAFKKSNVGTELIDVLAVRMKSVGNAGSTVVDFKDIGRKAGFHGYGDPWRKADLS